MTIPYDIIAMIAKLFPLAPGQQEVWEHLTSLWATPLNVGADQYARAMLLLSGGEIAEFRRLIESRLVGDPRDLIMVANQKPDKKGSGPYFTKPFLI